MLVNIEIRYHEKQSLRVPEESILNLETVWGPEQASAACAVALVKLAERTLKS